MEAEPRAPEAGPAAEAGRGAKVSVSAILILVILVVVALVVLAIDQVSKYLVVTGLQEGRQVDVIGTLLRFRSVRNPGAAFSIGTDSTWIFSIIATGVLVFVIWYARRIRSAAWAVLFGLLLGGLLGNLSDRLLRPPGFGVGEVVDFVQIPLLPAIFNLADVAIVSSMILFLVLTVLGVGMTGKRAGADVPTEVGADSHPDAESDERTDHSERTS